MVDNIEPIHFGDDIQMNQLDGEASMVLDSAMIIIPAPLNKSTKKETIMHAGSPEQNFIIQGTTTSLNFKPTWDVKTCNQEPKCDITPPKLSPCKTQVYLINLDFIINFKIMF
jgi:hypothetical protein